MNSLLQHAVKERASDVHLEPFEREIRVRFRIDDVLYEPMKPLPRRLQASIVSRIKIMGGLNIAEKRLPQDGRIRLKIAGRDYDVRLSTVPIAHGERVVLRLLPRTQDLLNLERVGFNEKQRERARAADRPPERHRAGHRPHRLGQDHHALLGARPHQLDGQEHHHHRGPGRDPAGPASGRSR